MLSEGAALQRLWQPHWVSDALNQLLHFFRMNEMAARSFPVGTTPREETTPSPWKFWWSAHPPCGSQLSHRGCRSWLCHQHQGVDSTEFATRFTPPTVSWETLSVCWGPAVCIPTFFPHQIRSGVRCVFRVLLSSLFLLTFKSGCASSSFCFCGYLDLQPVAVYCQYRSPGVHFHVVGMSRFMFWTWTNRACPLLFILFLCLFLSL